MDPVTAAINAAILQAQQQIYFAQFLLATVPNSPQIVVLINTTQAYIDQLRSLLPTTTPPAS